MRTLLSMLAAVILASENFVFAKSTTTVDVDTVKSTNTVTAELIVRLNLLDIKLIAGLSSLKPHVKELAELDRQWQSLKSGEDSSRISKIVETKYPASYALPGLEKNSVALEKLIDKSIRTLRTSTKSCFPNAASSRGSDIHCRKEVDGCRDFFGAKAGDLYQIYIDSGLNEIKRDFLPYPEWKSSVTVAGSASDYRNSQNERRFSFCKLAAIAGEEFTPLSVFQFGKAPSWYKRPDELEPKGIVEFCTALKIDGKVVNDRLDNLIGKYPKSYSLTDFKKYREEVKKMCSTGITSLCKNTFMLKDKMILTYGTKRCEAREVTRADVQKDVDEFRKMGATEAAILQQSAIIDIIDACQAALKAGYSWDYKAPDLRDCKAN